MGALKIRLWIVKNAISKKKKKKDIYRLCYISQAASCPTSSNIYIYIFLTIPRFFVCVLLLFVDAAEREQRVLYGGLYDTLKKAFIWGPKKFDWNSKSL